MSAHAALAWLCREAAVSSLLKKKKKKNDAPVFAVMVPLVDLVKSAMRSHVGELVVLTTIHTFEVAGRGQYDRASYLPCTPM